MLGAIAGDIIGSVYENSSPGFKEFVLFSSRATFTDDTVLTVAVASAILHGRDFESELRAWGERYPGAGYGHGFSQWLSDPQRSPGHSFGNGSAMRVSPVGWAFADVGEVAAQARATALPSHGHPEGMQGAQAVAAAVHAARHGASKAQIADLMTGFGYDCAPTMEAQRARGWVGVTCREAVPAATVAFLASTDFEDAVRNAVFLGGDTDTTACIAGSIAEAFYGGVPPEIEATVLDRLDEALLGVVDRFRARFVTKQLMSGRKPQARSSRSTSGDGAMSAPNFRDWLKEGERELQSEVRDRNAPDEIEWPSNDDAKDVGATRAEDPVVGRYVSAMRNVIGRYVAASGVASPVDVPTRHKWQATQEHGRLPMEAGIVAAARRVAVLFGCGCTWETLQGGYGRLEFRGFDDNPSHAIGAMKALVEEAVTTAIKQRPGELAKTDSMFPLRLRHFVGGYCAAVAETLTSFLRERAQAWDANGGKMQLLIYGSGQVVAPDVAGPPADDDDYRNGVAFGSGRA